MKDLEKNRVPAEAAYNTAIREGKNLVGTVQHLVLRGKVRKSKRCNMVPIMSALFDKLVEELPLSCMTKTTLGSTGRGRVRLQRALPVNYGRRTDENCCGLPLA
jgi:hypothetical protein